MSGIATHITGSEPFWQRVRQTFSAIRPTRAEPAAPRGRSVRIEEELEAAWDYSASRNVSMSVIVVELDLMTEFFSVYGRAVADDCVATAAEIIAEMLPRANSHCLPLDRASFIVVLPDYPALMARKLAETIAETIADEAIAHKESHAGVVTASAGLVVVNPRDGFNASLFDAAAEALKKAQRRGLGRVELVDMRPMQQEQQVLHEEAA